MFNPVHLKVGTKAIAKCLVLLLVFAAFIVPTMPVRGQGNSEETPANFRRRPDRVPGEYIVVFKDEVPKDEVVPLANELARVHRGTVLFIYEDVLKGFAVRLPETSAVAISHNPLVDNVTENYEFSLTTTQSNATWNLNRIDQRGAVDPFSTTHQYNYGNTGSGVNVYVVDTGIYRSHTQFGGRAAAAFDAVDDDNNPATPTDTDNPAGDRGQDCNGHGTHVAGIIGGATYGVAKSVNLYSVRVVGCNGTFGTELLAGLNWLISNHIKPAVANMSLEVFPADPNVDQAVRNLIARGVLCVVGAGNGTGRDQVERDVADVSPARVAEAITVSATDRSDTRPGYANFGAGVDVFAPGGGAVFGNPNVSILSAYPFPDVNNTNVYDPNATYSLYGTSMATPHVTGVAAMYLQSNRYDSPYSVSQRILDNSTKGVVQNAGAGSRPDMIYSNFNMSPQAPSWSVPFYRYYSPGVTDHFFTTNFNELGFGSLGYNFYWRECSIFSQQQSGSVALYRYYNSTTGDHFYTTDYNELGAGAQGYAYEWIQGYVYPSPQAGTVPLYRFWNATVGDHLYTINLNDLDLNQGYVYEKVQCYVYP
ncbi:MAG: S8 family serine peptidase [Blastocatellia bacterium]